MQHPYKPLRALLAAALLLSVAPAASAQVAAHLNWHTLGAGVTSPNGYVAAIAVIGTDVYIGGSFSEVGGVPANNIAKWDGAAWSALGSGITDSLLRQDQAVVTTLAVQGNDLIVGGGFTRAGGQVASSLARWNGMAWSGIGTGLTPLTEGVSILATVGSSIYAGTSTTCVPCFGASYLYQWDGSTWHTLLSDTSGSVPTALLTHQGNLYVGGNVVPAGVTSGVARWDGTSWTGYAGLLGDQPSKLVFVGNDLYVGTASILGAGSPGAGGRFGDVLKWDGTTWQGVPTGLPVYTTGLAVVGHDLYISGALGLLRWDGQAVTQFEPVPNAMIETMAVAGNRLYIGGSFTQIDSLPASRIAYAELAPLGVAAGTSVTTLSVAPNPALDRVQVSGVGAGEVVRVFDAVGRQVLTGTVAADGTATLRTAALPAGVYMVRSGTQSRRLLKQ